MFIDYLKLIRPQQWYKNLIMFIPLIFAGKLFDFSLIKISFLGFFILCLMSSLGYIANDLFDLEKDKLHPKKKKRPLPSGKLTVKNVFLFALILLFLSSFLMLFTNFYFSVLAFFLFFLTSLYTVALKEIPILDVHMIAFNFIIRAVSGAFLISVSVSPWLFICVFLLALFWAVGKRAGEISKLGGSASKHRKVNAFYNKEMLYSMSNILSGALIVSYMLYTITNPLMMLTIPIATFMVFRYLFFIHSDSEVVQRSEKVFLDKQMISALFLWVLISVFAIYV